MTKANNLKLLINNVDLSGYLEHNNWSITQNFGKYGDSFQFYLYDEHNYEPGGVVSQNFTVQPLQTCVFTDTTIGETLFSGVTSQPAYVWLSPNLANWQVVARDWTYLADNAIVTAEYVGLTADNIMKNLATLAGVGITTNNVQLGPVIDHVKINHLQLSAAWTLIAKLASQTIEYDWFVDSNHDLHFFNWTQVTPIKYYFTDDITDLNPNAGHYTTESFQYLYDGQTIRNRIIVRGANFTNFTTDHYNGDGNTTAWPMTYPLNTSSPGFALVVGGTSKSIAIYTAGGDPPAGATTQYVAWQSPNGVWFLHTGTDPAPGNVPINFSYKYQAPIVTQVDDVASQATYASLPNAGIFEMYIADTSLTTVLSAKARGQREVQEYSEPQERVTFTTSEEFLGHVRAGDVFRFKNLFIPDSKNNWQPGISALFLCVNNTISGGGGFWRNYQITAVRVSDT